MKVAVYFEAKAGAHMVAQFDEEETYMACLPALETLATSKGYIVTESLDQQQCFAIHVHVKDVYGKRVAYPVCDKAKIFAAIAGTTSLTETTLKCIRKLGFDIQVVPNEQPTLGV